MYTWWDMVPNRYASVLPKLSYGCHGWLALPCFRHCWTSQQWHPLVKQWHPTGKVELERALDIGQFRVFAPPPRHPRSFWILPLTQTTGEE